MSSFFRSFSSTSRSSSGCSPCGDDTCHEIVDFGSQFHQAIQKTAYKCILKVTGKYDFYLDTSDYHWYMVVHYNAEGGDFQYISLEITTDPLFGSYLIPTMRALKKINNGKEIDLTPIAVAAIIGDRGGPIGKVFAAIRAHAADKKMTKAMLSMSQTHLKKVGTVRTSMKMICENADAVRSEMGKKEYNLFTNNCQHFCRKVLEKHGLQPTAPAPTPAQDPEKFDSVDENFKVCT